jgi:glycerol kinase
MQFQADILGVRVERPECIETTALGAAYLAGLATGFWPDKEELIRRYQINCQFEPQMADEEREKFYQGWQKAVSRVIDWEREDG